MYTLAMAKNDYKQGWINGFTLVRKGSEWMIEVNKDESPLRRCICAARGDIRMFKTIDAAVKTAEQIGFKVHAVKLQMI